MLYKRIERNLENVILKSENCENHENSKNKFTRNKKKNFKDYVWYLIGKNKYSTNISYNI